MIKDLHKTVIARLAAVSVAASEEATSMVISKDFKAAFQAHFKPIVDERLRYSKDRQGFTRLSAHDQLEYIFSQDVRREPVWKTLADDYLRDCALFFKLSLPEKIALFTPTFKPLR